MKTILTWLAEMEALAADFYRASADAFGNDQPLYVFLADLAKQEDDHTWR